MPPAELDRAASRNLLLLSAGMAALYGMVQLAVGVATLTFEEIGGSSSFSGIAPAVFLGFSALAAVPAGRAMDRSGRRPILAGGFAVGAAGCLLVALGIAVQLLIVALAGFALAGMATGTILLSRAAGADMFPPERRPRAIALVLFGAVFGALLGPFVFGPLLAGEDHGDSPLDIAWLGGAAFMVIGLAIATRLNPDPREIADALGAAVPGGEAAAQPLRRTIARPGVAPAVVAVLAVWGSMLTVMVLSGAALVDHGHSKSSIFPVLAAHFVGMFGLFAVVGPLIERIGRRAALVAGLLLLSGSCGALAVSISSVALTAVSLFGVGLGWSTAFVAATAELSERSVASERATLIGFADLVGGMTGALLAVAGGIALDEAGLASIALAVAALPLGAAIWIVRERGRPAAPASARA